MKIKLTKKQKMIVRETLEKMDHEGGKDYYFNSYTSSQSFSEDHPFLPVEIHDAVKKYVQASSNLDSLLEQLSDEVGED